MFDYQSVMSDLITLVNASSAYKGWQEKQARTFISVGEYGLALDSIAYAYLKNNVTMPADTYSLFDKLALTMDLEDDPEFQGIADLRKKQTTLK